MGMPGRFHYDAATVEAIDQDSRTRDLVLRMADLVRCGRLEPFVELVRADPQLDEETRGWVLALAESKNFLLAAALYLKRSRDVN
jgi:hypothetical protein